MSLSLHSLSHTPSSTLPLSLSPHYYPLLTTSYQSVGIPTTHYPLLPYLAGCPPRDVCPYPCILPHTLSPSPPLFHYPATLPGWLTTTHQSVCPPRDVCPGRKPSPPARRPHHLQVTVRKHAKQSADARRHLYQCQCPAKHFQRFSAAALTFR